jgi:hypothetical protein
MAKRQRGGSRPGRRAPLQRGGRQSAAPISRAAAPISRAAAPERPAGGLREDELERAAELEARIVAEEQAAAAALTRGRERRRPGTAEPSAPRTRAAGALTSIAHDEYRYVVADLRKIVAVFSLIFGLLIASWLLLVISGLIEF